MRPFVLSLSRAARFVYPTHLTKTLSTTAVTSSRLLTVMWNVTCSL